MTQEYLDDGQIGAKEMILVKSTSIAGVSLLLLACTCKCSTAGEPQVAKVRIHVFIEQGILDEINVGTDDDVAEHRDGAVLVPCFNAFVYLSPGRTLNRGLPYNDEFIKQLKDDKARQRRQIAWRYSQGVISPRCAIARTGDTMKWEWKEVFLNFPGLEIPGFLVDDSIPVDVPTFLPVQVEDLRERHESGWLLVVDSDIAQLTNAEGLAHFDNIPVGIELVMRVNYPWFRHRVEYQSDTLKFIPKRGGLFVLKADDGSPQSHKISIKRTAKDAFPIRSAPQGQ